MDEAIAAFYEVRELPYAIDQAHDADTLLAAGAGDCLAKASLLAMRLHGVGVPTRLVRWRYELPAVVLEIGALPSRIDVHRAVEAMVDGRWCLVDATHDSGLRRSGLTVASWDGVTSTEPAYPVIGPVLVEGQDDEAIRTAQEDVAAWVRACPPDALGAWRSAYIDWLQAVRSDT